MMIDPALALAILLAGMYSFWMGGNDMANSVAPLVGGGILDFKKASILFAISMALGAFIQGYMVIKTLGKGVVSNISVYESVVASIAAIIWIAIATVKGIPISTSQSITSGVIGIGLFRFLMIRLWDLKLDVILKIVLSWILSPLIAILIAWAICLILLRYSDKLPPRVVNALSISTLIFTAYSFGANDIANAIGVYVASLPSKYGLPDTQTQLLLTTYAVLLIALGGFIAGKKVVETVGFRITRLTPLLSISANTDGITVWLFTTIPYVLFGYGMPISTTYAAVGAVIGTGIARYGRNGLSIKTVVMIISSWVFTLPIVASISMAIAYLLKIFNIL